MVATSISPLVYSDANSASVSSSPRGNVRARDTNAKIIWPINEDTIEGSHRSFRINNQYVLVPVLQREAAARDLRRLCHPQSFLPSPVAGTRTAQSWIRTIRTQGVHLWEDASFRS